MGVGRGEGGGGGGGGGGRSEGARFGGHLWLRSGEQRREAWVDGGECSVEPLRVDPRVRVQPLREDRVKVLRSGERKVPRVTRHGANARRLTFACMIASRHGKRRRGALQHATCNRRLATHNMQQRSGPGRGGWLHLRIERCAQKRLPVGRAGAGVRVPGRSHRGREVWHRVQEEEPAACIACKHATLPRRQERAAGACNTQRCTGRHGMYSMRRAKHHGMPESKIAAPLVWPTVKSYTGATPLASFAGLSCGLARQCVGIHIWWRQCGPARIGARYKMPSPGRLAVAPCTLAASSR